MYSNPLLLNIFLYNVCNWIFYSLIYFSNVDILYSFSCFETSNSVALSGDEKDFWDWDLEMFKADSNRVIFDWLVLLQCKLFISVLCNY